MTEYTEDRQYILLFADSELMTVDDCEYIREN